MLIFNRIKRFWLKSVNCYFVKQLIHSSSLLADADPVMNVFLSLRLLLMFEFHCVFYTDRVQGPKVRFLGAHWMCDLKGGPINDTINSEEANIQHVCKCDMETWSLQCTCSVPLHRLYVGELPVSTIWENYSMSDQPTSGQSQKRSLNLLAWVFDGSLCAGFHSSCWLKPPISEIQPLSFRVEQLLA